LATVQKWIFAKFCRSAAYSKPRQSRQQQPIELNSNLESRNEKLLSSNSDSDSCGTDHAAVKI